MKNIFTKTLTLIALLSLSIGVWGDPYLSLTFDASDKNDNGQMIDDNYNLTQHGKEWTTSVFYYSKAAEDKIKNNAGFSDGKSHISLSEASKFRSKNTYHFDAGTYTVVLTAYGRDNSKCDVPDLYIGDNKYTSRDKDYVENIGDGKHQDITYTITTTGGDLYVKGEFIKTTNLSENVGWGELIFTKATPTTFTITYDANNATSGTVPAATVGNGNVTLATNSGNLARTGYTFSGWNTKSDGTGTSYEAGANYNLTANITLYAKWTKLHTVTFNVNGHSSAPSPQQVADGGKVTQPANPQAMGWGFDGWYKDQACTNAWNFSTDVVTEDITLYAKWNVGWTFYCNSDNNVEHKLIDNGDGILTWTQHIDANITDYFHFGDGSGYCYAVTGDHIMDKDNCTAWKVYQNQSTYVGLRTTAAGDYTFTVSEANEMATELYVSVTYPASVGLTIDYQGHGGNNYTIYTNPNCTIASKDLPQTPSATDYKFWGWYANAECTTPFDFTAPITANTTAYAKWTLWETSNYTMHTQNTQDGNKAWFIRTEAGSQSYYIFDFAIPETSYSEQFFVGQGGYWYGDKMGYKQCSKSANWYYGWLPLTNLQGEDGCKITLGSAVGAIGTLKIEDDSCDPNLYISFDPQGYGLSYGTPNQEGWVNMAFVQENASTVWNTTQVTLTSDMLGKSFYVGLAKQGGGYVYSSRSDNNMVGFSNTVAFTTMGVLTKADTWRSGNLTLADAEQVGHFQIWTDNTAQNGCCHFVLHYNATFVYNNGQTNTSTEYKSCLADNNITFPTPEAKTGYTFEGWYDNSSFTGTKYDAGGEFNLTNTGRKTFYAKWTPKTSHITFNANGGKIDGNDTKVLDYIYDGSSLTLPTPNWTGHRFDGWFTETTGGTQIDNVGGTNKPSEDVEYFAQWTINKHTLTWAGIEGATVTGEYTQAGLVNYGTTLVAPTVSKTGYEFTGWSPTIAATMPDEDATYTAQWNIINYTITYHNVEASEHTNPATYTITSADITLSAPTARTGYEFGGWYIDESLQTPITKISTGSHENKDIYAKWTAKQYTITLDKNASDGNNGSVKFTYNSGEKADFSAPTRDNYVIEGFYAENTCTTKVLNADGSLVANVSGYTDNSGHWVKDETCTLYTKWAIDYCSKTKFIECEDEWLEDLKSKASEAVLNTGYYTNFSGRGFMDYKGSGGETFYFVHLGAATYEFEISRTNVPSGGHFYLYSTNGTGESVTYKSVAYKRISSIDGNVSGGGGSEGTAFTKVTISNITLSEEGDYLIGLNGGQWSSFDYIKITADKSVFCPTMYTVNFTQPTEGQGTTSAQTVGGDAITSGDEVPEGTEVIFTWNEATGYDFVSFYDGTNTYTQNPCTLTVNSNLNITTNVEVEVTKHTLTVNAGEHGSVSPTSKQVGEGREVTITATPAEGYKFDKWTSTGVDLTGHDTDNPLTITMPTNDVTLTATWKVDYCKPYLQLNCVDYDSDKMTTGDADSKATISKHDTYATITNGGAIYLPVTLPAGTYYIKVSGRKDNSDVWVNYLTEGNGNNVYDGVKYSKTNWHNVGTFGNSFEEKTVSWDNQGQNITLNSETKLLFGITGHTNADYEWIRIYKSSGEPFCPEMYEVNFTQPSHGSTSAQIKDGDAITTGTEVPEGTDVIFTWNEATGYDFVSFYDGTNTYTQNPCTLTVNSNLNITTTVEVEVTKHTLTASVANDQSSWGHVDQTSQQVGEGRPAQVTAIVDNNQYRFDHWSSTDVDLTELQANTNPLQFTMPTKDVAVVAHFVFDTVHNMIATGTSANVGSHIDRHSNQDRITITSITDNTGSFQHNVLQYAINFQSTSDYSAYTVPTDANYSANAKATGYAFWYMADDNIYMEFNIGGDHGIVCKLPSTNGVWKYFYVADATAATATSGFEIWMNYSKDSWGMSSLTGTVYFSEIQATNVTEMSPIVPPVNLTVEKNPVDGGTVTTSPATTTGLTKGTPVTLTATPETNYRFVNWTVGGTEVSTEATYIRTVNATETITANFVRVYTLVVNKDANIASVTGAGQYAEGESVTVTATAAQSYKFTKWTKDNASGEDLATTSSYTFDMPATDNYTVYANSEQDIVTYHITLGTCINGTIAATVGGETYTGTELTANTPVVLTAYPADGYGFVKWQDGNTDNSRTIFANAETQAITWTATFDQIHTVTTEFGKPGSEVTGGGTYPIGGQVTLEAFVSDKEYELDYNFSHWEQVSGTAPITGHENDNPLTFTMPAQDLKLKAIYAPVECVDTFVIQCEDDNAYIPYNKQGEDLTKYPNSIPHDGQCGPYHDYYNGYHGTGYYDYKSAESAEMYYPIELPASTYKFEIWSASNGDKNCWMNLYVESDDASSEVVYKGVNYKKTNNVTANNNCGELGYFAISGTIDNVVLSSPKSVIIGLYCGDKYGSFDQIKITATEHVFCAPLPTTNFVINAGETKEIPVCGVNNLIIYDGGQANNEENVEVKTSIKHIRQVKQLDVWEDFALPFTATSIQVEDPDDHNMYDIYPAIKQYDGNKEEWIVKPGFFYMQELQHEEMATVIGTEFRQRWEHSQNLFPQVNTPYIIEFIHEQSGGYFLNTFITYGMTGSTEVVGYDNAIVNNGSWPQDGTKPTFHYVANNAVVPVVPYDAYVLSDDHTMFELKEQPKILPFHCYIQASAETKAKAPRLMLSGGGGTPTTLVPIYIDAEHQNYKVMIDEVIYIVRDGKIYTVMGQLVK